MKTNKSDTAASKKQYGTLTATQDANNDYTSSAADSSVTGSVNNKNTASSLNEYGTLTATQDANDDYVSSKNKNCRGNSKK